MASIYGILGIADGERVMLNTIGQRVVFDAVTEYLANYNAEIQAALRVLVAERTSDHKRRFKLPGGGMLQRRGGQAESGAVKPLGEWDVAIPLDEYGAQVAWTRTTYAYMTTQDLARTMDAVRIQDLNTLRFEMMRALLNNTARSVTDPHWGGLTIQPLANGDAVTYPPVLGSQSDATENHYLESGYLAAAISNTNDPVVTAVNELQEHFGAPSGGGNIAIFVNNAHVGQLAALTDFVEVPDSFVRAGSQTAVPESLPSGLPGRIVGRHNAGAWIVEWRQWPANYVFALDMDQPGPLLMREDPADTGLGTGLQIVSTDQNYPFQQSHFTRRFGVGVGNRLNGVVIELGNGGTYTVPAGF